MPERKVGCARQSRLAQAQLGTAIMDSEDCSVDVGGKQLLPVEE
jgi:hypothetical protein